METPGEGPDGDGSDGDGLETGDGSLSPFLEKETKNRPLPTMSSPRVLFYKALRQLTISLYLSKQS
jgi:hypothetical protein